MKIIFAAVLVVVLATNADASVYRFDLTHDYIRYPGVQLAADLAQGTCQYYASPPTDQLCVYTTEPLCKKYS
jgi:hypothetical protein